MKVCGIDYSMSSPAICVHIGSEWSLANCKFHFITDKKKCQVRDSFFEAYSHSDYLCEEQRFDNISSWALDIIEADAKVFLEGYAYASKGNVFSIGENTGLLKWKLWERRPQKCPFTVLAPSTIKKFASGKGNANKILMHESFVEETSIHIEQHFDSKPGSNPISDIIDSYYIAKLGFHMLNKPA